MEFAWHVHHRILFEVLSHPIETRREYIRGFKDKDEQPLRLRLLRPVKGQLPEPLVKAADVMAKAFAAYNEAWVTDAAEETDVARANKNTAKEKYFRAQDVYYALRNNNRGEIEALHAKECPDCPWDGTTIFSDKL